MSEAVLKRPGPFTMLPAGMLGSLPRAARRLIDEILWQKTEKATIEVRITDREIADRLGCAMRTAQKAVHDVCAAFAAEVEGKAIHLVDRWFKHGPRSECGRMLKIVAPQLVPVAKEDEAPAAAARPKGKPAAKGKPAEQLQSRPAAEATATRRVVTESAPPTPEEEAEARRTFEECARRERARKALAAAEEEKRGGRPNLDAVDRREEDRRIERALDIGMGIEKRRPDEPDVHRRE